MCVCVCAFFVFFSPCYATKCSMLDVVPHNDDRCKTTV